MNHYPHHIGDFDKATRHLTRIERSVYRDLIDLYYDTEQRLTLDKAALCRRIIARTNEESSAVEQVLSEFFTETSTGWYHDRCEEEIDVYRANASQKSIAGKASAEAKRLKKLQALNENSTYVERSLNSAETAGNGESTNRKPVTVNQEPRTNNQEKAKSKPLRAVGADIFPPEIPDQLQRDFMALRKAKKSPLTQTAMEGIAREADKAGISLQSALETCCQRGWSGFNAEWVANAPNAPPTRQMATGKQARRDNYAAQAAAARGEDERHGGNIGRDITGESIRVT